jgi:cytochrome c oxidase subunit 2
MTTHDVAEAPPGGTVPPGGGEADIPAWRRPSVRPVLAIWVVFTIALLFFAPVPARLMGTAASPSMQEIETTVTWFTALSAPVAALVWAILLYSLFRWRHRGAQPPPEDGPGVRDNSRVFTSWLVGSTVLCLIVLFWGLVVIAPRIAEANPAQEPIVVDVTGQQWTWSFDYPDEGGKTATELYLPVGRTASFVVKSEDVVHSFWIVQLGVKIDANPGEKTVATVRPTQIGTFTVRCAELCGLYHSYMQTTVHVVSTADFDAWVGNPAGASP